MKTNERTAPESTADKAFAVGISGEQLGVAALFDTAVLVAAINGKIDLNQLARETLAGRGLDAAGKWVGFERAAEVLGCR